MSEELEAAERVRRAFTEARRSQRVWMTGLDLSTLGYNYQSLGDVIGNYFHGLDGDRVYEHQLRQEPNPLTSFFNELERRAR